MFGGYEIIEIIFVGTRRRRRRRWRQAGKKIGESRKDGGKKIVKKKFVRWCLTPKSQRDARLKAKFVMARENRKYATGRKKYGTAVRDRYSCGQPDRVGSTRATERVDGGGEYGVCQRFRKRTKTSRPPSRACPDRRRTLGPPSRSALCARNSRPYPPPPPGVRLLHLLSVYACGYCRYIAGDGLYIISEAPYPFHNPPALRPHPSPKYVSSLQVCYTRKFIMIFVQVHEVWFFWQY